MEDSLNCTPVGAALLPSKSKPIYDKEFDIFNKWRAQEKVVDTTEDVLLAYYNELSNTRKASSLLSSYSMLRACLSAYENFDISKFRRLQAFLKSQSDGYQPKKSKIFKKDEIHCFINEADDLNYLAFKVILIIGYCGGLRRDELTKMLIDNVKFVDDIIYVSVPVTKRVFVISDAYWVNLVKKYVKLRPEGASRRFFLTYRNGHCVRTPMGINKISEVPRLIASNLKLCNPELYTGLCFKRSSMSNQANKGGDLITLKKYGGCNSSAVAKGYIENYQKKKNPSAQQSSFTSHENFSILNLNETDDILK